ncbi:MAG: ATP-binding protein [Roseburia faecis]|nr:ATP-binding protein [Roseburia faecis]MDY4477001.1 ATP-binding protein [Roseburia faecis]MDY6313192.1 ATP-binding protein [Lachnospiraceae bacterium]MDY6354106.1 ATP-binding protein [Lachnospiraceae bacterium]
MKRFALEKLKIWKEKPDRKPLIIRGARQVGKTWLMKEFGKTCFEKTAYVNFDSNPRMQQLFEGEIDVERMILAISAETGVSINCTDTLLIFDEVQEVPKALGSLKYFCENAPEYAIVAAGSLLGVAMHKGTSFPVGKVDFMDLYPLSFQEFLCALGEERFVTMLQSTDTDMVTMFKTKYIDRLREYYYVGGMPEAVQNFVLNKDYNKVREIQKNLLNYYQQDFSKHAKISLVPRLNLVWNSIPMQLAKENKKYIYGQVREGARAKDFELAIQWLLDCGLIHKVHRVKKLSLPLKAYMDLDAFKIYMLDVGLLLAMADLDASVIIDGNRIFTEFKGALTEQYVLQQMIAELGVEPYYYTTANSTGEIDFMLQAPGSVIPVEVKAEENLRAKSLRAFCEKYHPQHAVRTSMSDFREQDWMTNIPLYNIDRIGEYLK